MTDPAPFPVPPARIAEMRAFNRFHTALVGALEEGMYASPLSLPQARALHEIGAADHAAQSGGEPGGARLGAADLARALRMDEGQLSRILAALDAQGLIERLPDPADGRRRILCVTEAGRAMHGMLEAGSKAQVAGVLGRLAPAAQQEAAAAMARLQALFGEEAPPPPILLREPKVGELGQVVGRQAAWYHANLGWNGEWEAVAMEILSRFDPAARPGRERGWIADIGGEPAGSIFLAEDADGVARLRLLWVDERARGRGLGGALVGACMDQARAAGYARMRLWTMSTLVAARRIYAAAGFAPVSAEEGVFFGKTMASEMWEAQLQM